MATPTYGAGSIVLAQPKPSGVTADSLMGAAIRAGMLGGRTAATRGGLVFAIRDGKPALVLAAPVSYAVPLQGSDADGLYRKPTISRARVGYGGSVVSREAVGAPGAWCSLNCVSETNVLDNATYAAIVSGMGEAVSVDRSGTQQWVTTWERDYGTMDATPVWPNPLAAPNVAPGQWWRVGRHEAYHELEMDTGVAGVDDWNAQVQVQNAGGAFVAFPAAKPGAKIRIPMRLECESIRVRWTATTRTGTPDIAMPAVTAQFLVYAVPIGGTWTNRWPASVIPPDEALAQGADMKIPSSATTLAYTVGGTYGTFPAPNPTTGRATNANQFEIEVTVPESRMIILLLHDDVRGTPPRRQTFVGQLLALPSGLSFPSAWGYQDTSGVWHVEVCEIFLTGHRYATLYADFGRAYPTP